jgi:hypothetical protein
MTPNAVGVVPDGTGNLPYQNVWNSDAIRLARFELGIEITLDEDGDFGVVNLAPGYADPFGTRHAFDVLNARITRGAVIRGTIKYPPAAGLGNFDTGMLVVAKAVLWCELPDGCSPTARERKRRLSARQDIGSMVQRGAVRHVHRNRTMYREESARSPSA